MKQRTAVALSTLLALAIATTQASHSSPTDQVIQTLELELKRSMEKLKNAGKAPVYFLAYRLYDAKRGESISAMDGAIQSEDPVNPWRTLAVEMRVGSPKLDNTHFLRRDGSRPVSIYENSVSRHSNLPGNGGGLPLREALWLKTDQAFKYAQERYLSIKASDDVLAAEEDLSGDFSVQEAQHFIDDSDENATVNRAEWEARIRRLSKIFLHHKDIMHSWITFASRPSVRYLVDSEGTIISEKQLSQMITITATALTNDGMHIQLHDSIVDTDLSKLNNETMLTKRIEKLADSMDALRVAPLAESYVGPAILSGRAAAVFFHETFGHRVEAVHEKSEVEGKTFVTKIGKSVMPSFVSVVDDPTASEACGEQLNGHYRYDDEGVLGQKVTLAKKGILTGFLLGRTPLQGFDRSNGHGRCAPGWNPTARQSNLFVQTSPDKQLSPLALRAELIKEAKKQKKTYGLYFQEISGGSTGTNQATNQSYNIFPKVIYKVFVDGRKDQLIRGADIVGTPLSALEKIIASGTEYSVFNGSCGRDSGFIPVSAVAPSLLVQSMEIKRTAKTFQKPPILPDPNETSTEKQESVPQ